jgi:hypothetical protein
VTSILTCPECGSHHVRCVRHPTARGWHVFECQECGFEGGDHKVYDEEPAEPHAYAPDFEAGW